MCHICKTYRDVAYIFLFVCVYSWTHVYICVFIYVCKFTSLRIRTRTCIYMRIRIHISVYMCIHNSYNLLMLGGQGSLVTGLFLRAGPCVSQREHIILHKYGQTDEH